MQPKLASVSIAGLRACGGLGSRRCCDGCCHAACSLAPEGSEADGREGKVMQKVRKEEE